ncbi:methyltransferase family protein [Streptantibioticus cattleyicolor]|uniref:Isoprenylcysteine carboxyl methyltransferase n=1 Tax=Streptantibioticus cattleyicolor (strain ATCC 35852 / DSM 46488 / JCM 4925 / NBRC 14057 / NRRL 8057) TaxID=1003195 RepID=F8JIU2_STREN|nr:isoprenylcysteine carboxylmethyltransferase family protein [Streptantibioticus cattleyicolor]AEW98975.1 isoprenylcysteine carboxyl methyltransferase [Streptantibioticus cattleyicolor NRRL 8057 = DSM 46488]CCB71981.1 putative Isoprenylcysteine carboxyl methyltransferase [Streptantibioticus cattleyicolor NRRL 8057 = DSM 46488]
MRHVVDTALTWTLWVWVAAEFLLQARQWRHSARTERTEWLSFALFAVLIGGGVALAGPVGDAVPAVSYPAHGPVLRVTVLVVAWAGIALRLWAIVALGRFFRGTVHIQQGHRVVTSGPYRWVRHPAYSGLLLAGSAFAVLLGNGASWLLFAVCALVAVGYRIRVEERMLLDALGEEYRSYAARTRRLVPGVW